MNEKERKENLLKLVKTLTEKFTNGEIAGFQVEQGCVTVSYPKVGIKKAK